MSQEYSNPKRAKDAYSLPDIEVFHLTAQEAAVALAGEEGGTEGGWFWWPCFPGCIPDGPAIGPFKTRAEAIADAREGTEDDDDMEDEA